MLITVFLNGFLFNYDLVSRANTSVRSCLNVGMNWSVESGSAEHADISVDVLGLE